MDILAPVDGSDCSFRALGFAIEMADRYDGSVDVVHFAETESASTDAVVDRAQRVLDAQDVDADPEVSTDLEPEFRPSDRVGEDILDLVERRGYDHVVMGNSGAGALERAILGSAAETVLNADRVPVTVVP
ncbi:universal stress protein [Halobacterium bonnevillei]|uniref:Universal stress protein n=1 Tax=Halobacterium bonnevillei TaxID=2692200 RepID=A0A6B0SZ10_9EURY|nr:universal stress protein [Halobacterium bonnevillei]MXR22559.1 universal stress protein [Halobacterium bonnevillei]